jgi:hypothetical protein
MVGLDDNLVEPLPRTPDNEEEQMPTYYVEDYDGERNADAVEPVVLSPVVEAKVVEAESAPKAAKKTSRAQTKKKG